MATFIDQGYCFNAGEWTFRDAPLRSLDLRNDVYVSVRGWDSFEPWLSRLETLDPQTIWENAAGNPARVVRSRCGRSGTIGGGVGEAP